MKRIAGSVNNEAAVPWDETLAGLRIVSKETEARLSDPTTVLLMRDPETKAYNGVLLVFNFNPQHFKFEQRALVSVQQGRGGYLVSQNGLTAPRWTIAGHFGWKLRTVVTPHYVAQGVFGKITRGGNLIHRIPRLGQNIQDFSFDLDTGNYKSPLGQFLVGTSGSISINGRQRMDGQQAWYALRDVIGYYFEANQQRVKAGKPPLELIWYDSLHSLKWVVVPSGMPTLERSVSTQGMMPYTLEFIGVYDATRAQPFGWRLLDAWN